MAKKRKETLPKKQPHEPATSRLSLGQQKLEDLAAPNQPAVNEVIIENASGTTKAVFSLAVVLHLSLLYLALSSNLFQSRLQQVAMEWTSSYLVTTGQQYGLVPLELTHAESFDLPLRIQTRETPSTGQLSEWMTVEEFQPSNAPRWPNLARSLRVILEDDPENELLADFAFAVVRQLEAKSRNSLIDEIRLVQPFVPNFDEGSALADGLGGLLDTEPQVLYLAKVVRDQGRAVGLVPDQEDYRSSVAAKPADPNSPED